MTHYITKTRDGLYHVQNAIMGMMGQHHVHTEEGFKQWKAGGNIEDQDIVFLDSTKCSCGLTPSEVREHDGRLWKSDRF